MSKLPTSVEVSGLLRAAEADGGHGAVLRKGDPDRGTLVVLIASRGAMLARFERLLDISGAYSWIRTPVEASDNEKVADFLAKRGRFDADFWAIELDIAHPERFIAENLSEG